MPALNISDDLLFPPTGIGREVARTIYDEIKSYPIISPHGHTDPRWFADNQCFENSTKLLVTPDHYVLRMLYSAGIDLSLFGVNSDTNGTSQFDMRKAWRTFAQNYYLFRGTPSRLWLDWVFSKVFDLKRTLTEKTADHYYEVINGKLASDEFRPRALFEKFNIEIIATTESPLDDLKHHKKINASRWPGRIITTYRPDAIIDPEHEGFLNNIKTLSSLTNEDTLTWNGYLNAHRIRRAFFKKMGATATDHGHLTARTANLSPSEAEALFQNVLNKPNHAQNAELFRAQMLTEMARMSLEDGLVMQIHPGSFRNHNSQLFQKFGRDVGADIPQKAEFVNNLHPLLNLFGNEKKFKLIVFTLDESTYSRELAPLAGHYPALKVGPPWWFHDSPEGMKRYRQQMTETAGFYNTVGFNDDTRAFLSIPARHDIARRMDCRFLSTMVEDHRMTETEAVETAIDLTYRLPREAYNL